MTMTEPSTEHNYYRQIIAKTAKQHHLFSVHWELTYRCNLKCTHCYVVKPGDPGFEAPRPELSTEECKDIIDQLAEENALNITFSGGEPLIRSDFFEIARYARHRHFAIRIMTNGTLITPPVAEELATLYPVRVEMSVYGACAETHDGITLVPGSFERTMRAFQFLGKHGVGTELKTPLMKESIGQFKGIRALAGELGAVFRYNITITPKDNGCRSPLRHRLSDDDLLDLFRQELDPEIWRPVGIEPSSHICNMGLNVITIDPYGDVFPCVQIKMPAGNLREQSLRKIWRESLVLQRIRNVTCSDLQACLTCKFRQSCVYCPGLAFLEEGDLLKPPLVVCREAHLRFQVLEEKRRV